jgi:hypothetical protein
VVVVKLPKNDFNRVYDDAIAEKERREDVENAQVFATAFTSSFMTTLFWFFVGFILLVISQL